MCQGKEDAPVTLVELSDFECPFCGSARPLLDALAKKHGDKVRFCYLTYPLPRHPNALPAAQAALWARDQGKFWQMHDALFENQADLGPSALPRIAQSVGLDGKKLMEALKARTYEKEVQAMQAQGAAAGINATPSLFWNGRAHALGYTEAELRHTLEDEVEWKGAGGAWAKD
jgi:protein-disulfide isomerase